MFWDIQGASEKVDHFQKCISPVYDDVGSRSIYQNVQPFIRSKTDILFLCMISVDWCEKQWCVIGVRSRRDTSPLQSSTRRYVWIWPRRQTAITTPSQACRSVLATHRPPVHVSVDQSCTPTRHRNAKSDFWMTVTLFSTISLSLKIVWPFFSYL